MANCSSCGKKLSFVEAFLERDCASCVKTNNQSAAHLNLRGIDSDTVSSTTPNKTSTPDAPKTSAATIAYSSALIIAICSAISFFVLLENNNGFMGFMVLVSGLGGAIFFMIMAEISHNVASLVRLANAKKEEE